jgi:hypothetical protein
MELIIVFSTGRSGTALLGQYFGGLLQNRIAWNFRGNIAIAHEPFDELRQYRQTIKEIKEGKHPESIQFLLDEMEKNRKCSKYFITDNKLGRWFWKYFLEKGINLKVIYLFRNDKKTVKSIKTNFPQGIWWGYEPTDAFALTPPGLDFAWYHVKEAQEKWEKVREQLAPDHYIEVSFEKFLKDKAERERVQKFVGLTGFENLVDVKINVGIPFFGLSGYGDKKVSLRNIILGIISKLVRKKTY